MPITTYPVHLLQTAICSHSLPTQSCVKILPFIKHSTLPAATEHLASDLVHLPSLGMGLRDGLELPVVLGLEELGVPDGEFCLDAVVHVLARLDDKDTDTGVLRQS